MIDRSEWTPTQEAEIESRGIEIDDDEEDLDDEDDCDTRDRDDRRAERDLEIAEGRAYGVAW